jgi:hypothetical protein
MILRCSSGSGMGEGAAMDWIDLAQDKNEWWVTVDAVMNLQFL